MKISLICGLAALLAIPGCRQESTDDGALPAAVAASSLASDASGGDQPDLAPPDVDAPLIPDPSTGSIPATPGDPSSPPAAPSTPMSPPALPDFQHDPAGQLLSGTGAGATDQTIWAPTMRFPIEKAPAWANSQVWGVGGMKGPAGGQCDARNYSYPWRDNFCESRPYSNLFCGNGKGHQGQDIRPPTCKDNAHWAVASETGTITGIGGYTVFLTSKSGRLFRYLHLDMKTVREKLHIGQEVTRGELLAPVSNDFGNTSTTIHLHLEIKAPVTRDGTTVFTFVPPYSSLVQAYQRLLSVSPDAPR